MIEKKVVFDVSAGCTKKLSLKYEVLPGRKVKLSWNSIPGAKKYVLYSNSGGKAPSPVFDRKGFYSHTSVTISHINLKEFHEAFVRADINDHLRCAISDIRKQPTSNVISWPHGKNKCITDSHYENVEGFTLCIENRVSKKNRIKLTDEVRKEIKDMKRKQSPLVIKILQNWRIYAVKDYSYNQRHAPKKYRDSATSGGVFFDHSHSKKLERMKLPLAWLNSVVLKNT